MAFIVPEQSPQSSSNRRRADPNAPADAKGRTTLYQAIWYGDEELVKWLLEHGASAEVEDKEGKTPLSFAKENEKPTIVAILKKAGAKR
jgi:ankyrin repeat protein